MISSQQLTRRRRLLGAAVGAATLSAIAPFAGAAGVDGVVDTGEYNLTLATQTTPTGFGDNQSELDAALARMQNNGGLQLALTGNLEGSGNGLVIFIDSKAGGAVTSTTAGGYGVLGSVAGEGFTHRASVWGTDTDSTAAVASQPGSVLSPGFNPDFALEINHNGAAYFINVVDMTLPNQPPATAWDDRATFIQDPTDSTRSGQVGGTPTTGTLLLQNGAVNAGTLTHAFNNFNIDGVRGYDFGNNGGTDPLGDPLSAKTGFELLFSSLLLNQEPGQEIKILPFITNQFGDFLSNQFLPGLPGTSGNYLINLGGLGAPGGNPLFDAEAGFASPLPNFYITIPLPEWQGGSGGWSNDANWLIANPDGVNTTAKFAGAGAANLAVNVDVAKTLGGMVFDGGASYTLSGTGSITLDAFAGKTARINVISGNPTITVPIVVNHDLRLTVAQAANTLSMTGNMTYTGVVNLTKDGPGTAVISNAHVATLAIQQGTLRMSAKGTANSPSGHSVVTALTISAGAVLDLTNNSMVIDYTGDPGTLVNDTRVALSTNKITSSSADATRRIGYGDNQVLHKTIFSGQDVDQTSLLFKFTYAGDANLDGQVDVTDLGALATNWQTSNVWTGGDFNYDGFVDVTDLGSLATNWQAGVGNPLGEGSLQAAMASVGLGGTSVPEPAMLGGALLLLAPLVSRRRRS